MRRGVAVVTWLAAIALGVGTGHYLLPDRSTVLGSGPPGADHTGASSTPSASTVPESPPTAYDRKPPTTDDLLALKGFAKAGLTVTVYPQNGNTSPDAAVTGCTEERTVGARTLGDITGYDPKVMGTWSDTDSDGTADQVLAAAGSPAEAKQATERLLAAETTCQHEPPGHWVHGTTHQQLIEDGVWAAWLGDYTDEQNTTGEAPADEDPCGGVAFIRNGQRFGVLNVYICTDTEQLGTLAVAAAKRLG